MRANQLLKKINKLNLRSSMVRNVLEAIGKVASEQDEAISQVTKDMFFDTCSGRRLQEYEKEAGIVPMEGQDLDGRRSSVEAKWKSTGKINVEMLQSVADSWKYGKTEIDFVNNKIQVTFVDTLGKPKDTAGLEAAMDEVKPAHIAIFYNIIWILVSDVETMTISELESHRIEEFAY